jgi:hypothetical protein
MAQKARQFVLSIALSKSSPISISKKSREEDRRAQASQQRSGGTFEQFIGVKCQLKSDHL